MQCFWYALYTVRRSVYTTDEYGNRMETGEHETLYTEPVACRANISPATGVTANELFGSLEGYDKVLIMDDPHTPIDEYSRLWIDTLPTNPETPHDYIVKRVARSINSVAIAAKKVNVA